MINNEQNQITKRLIDIKKLFSFLLILIPVNVPVIILYLLGIFSVIIYRISLRNSQTADFFRDTLGYALRFILTGATYYIPFSLGEFILFISLPCSVFILVRFIIKIKRSDYKLKDFLKGLSRFTAFLCCFMFIFAFTLGICYGTSPVNKNIGFERRLISSGDLIYAMTVLISEANSESENIKYIYAQTGSTKMPYGLNELNKKLNESYINLSEEHDFLKLIRAKAKPIIISEIFSKMHITGIYSFFTGEANINIIFPDYNLPFAAAHEMAHLMGVAREDEANFTAFLACLYSGDSYIRYSGLVTMIEYLRTPLFLSDQDAYYEITAGLSSVIANELLAYSRFFDKYRNEPIAKVSSAVNDAYLKAQSEGRKEENEKDLGLETYGLARDLAAIYLCDIYKK